MQLSLAGRNSVWVYNPNKTLCMSVCVCVRKTERKRHCALKYFNMSWQTSDTQWMYYLSEIHQLPPLAIPLWCPFSLPPLSPILGNSFLISSSLELQCPWSGRSISVFCGNVSEIQKETVINQIWAINTRTFLVAAVNVFEHLYDCRVGYVLHPHSTWISDSSSQFLVEDGGKVYEPKGIKSWLFYF